ncbi:hypothetical protein GGE65_005401 [Skermanella aerolata]|jgi:hypothetical protein|uniref:hypothetical protein n=1 Tax=Skermanella aerolata TaxID=393310 RepID=UPI0011BEDF4F|nr:hypothetical protein [Skermanella aerolata]
MSSLALNRLSDVSSLWREFGLTLSIAQVMNSRFTICHKMPENDLRMETKRPLTLAFSSNGQRCFSAAGFCR